MKKQKMTNPKQVDFSIRKTCFYMQGYWENGSEVIFARTARVYNGFLYLHACDVTVYLSGGKVLKAGPGECLYLPRGSRYRLMFSNITKQPASLLINCMMEYEQKDHVLSSKPTVIPMKKTTQVKLLFEGYIRRAPSPAETKSLLWHLIALWIAAENEENNLGNLPPFLEKAVNYIETNANREISVADLANECHICQSYLRKQFQKYLGTSPKDFCLQKRLETAKRYLEMGELNVAACSRALEFSSPSYFSRLFKEKIGVAPSSLQKRR